MRRRFYEFARAFFPQIGGRRERERRQLLLAAALGVLAAAVLLGRFSARIRPQLAVLAQVQVQNEVTRIANEAVSEALAAERLSSSDLVSLQSVDGAVTTLTTDTASLNSLRLRILADIISQVENLDSHDLAIPLGAATGADLLMAFGPRLPVRVLSVASADAVYQNTFTEAGINQTMHRILLNVTISARVLLPGGVEEIEAVTPVCVAETILIGQVPNTYLGLGGLPPSD